MAVSFKVAPAEIDRAAHYAPHFPEKQMQSKNIFARPGKPSDNPRHQLLKVSVMSTVYVTQLPHKRDRETGVLIPAFNINIAQEHGELRIMMPPQAHYQPTEGILRTLRPVLDDYKYSNGDSLLLLGDVAIIAATVAYCTIWHGKFCVLRWDRTLGRYIRVEIDV